MHLLIVIGSCATVRADSSQTPVPTSDPWIEYDGQRHSVSQLTGEPFSDLQRALKAQLEPIPPSDTKVFLEPGQSTFPGGNGVDYFNYQTDGIVEIFLRARVMEQFEVTYGIKRQTVCDTATLESAIDQEAQLMGRLDQKMLPLLRANASGESIASALADEFPNAHFAAGVWLQTAQSEIALGRRALINLECFPPLGADNKPAPWFRDELITAPFRRELQMVVDRNKQTVINHLDYKRGKIEYLIIHNAQPNDLPTLQTIAKKVIDANGAIDQVALANADNQLQASGSPISIESNTSIRELMGHEYSISPNALPARNFVDVRAQNANASYLYVVTLIPQHYLKTYPTAPGNFAYDQGMIDFVRPIAEKVLASTKASAGIQLPTADRIANASAGGNLAPVLFGQAIPDPFEQNHH
jgi:hypothetical protein